MKRQAFILHFREELIMSLKILLFSRRKWDSAELELDRVWIGREEEGGCPESVPGLCHQFLVITKFHDYAEPSLTLSSPHPPAALSQHCRGR